MVNYLSILKVIGQLIALVLLGVLLRQWIFKKGSPKIQVFVEKYGLVFMLIVALVATTGSLYLSEIKMWTPCKLCWIQRIFIYPQVVLLAVAAWKKDKKIAPYIMALCLVGILFAVRHYIEQIISTFYSAPADSLVPCDATGVSCAKTYTFRFGYITIPMMAFTAMFMNFLTSIFLVKSGSKK